MRPSADTAGCNYVNSPVRKMGFWTVTRGISPRNLERITAGSMSRRFIYQRETGQPMPTGPRTGGDGPSANLLAALLAVAMVGLAGFAPTMGGGPLQRWGDATGRDAHGHGHAVADTDGDPDADRDPSVDAHTVGRRAPAAGPRPVPWTVRERALADRRRREPPPDYLLETAYRDTQDGGTELFVVWRACDDPALHRFQHVTLTELYAVATADFEGALPDRLRSYAVGDLQGVPDLVTVVTTTVRE
jgi:hypothetical protein